MQALLPGDIEVCVAADRRADSDALRASTRNEDQRLPYHPFHLVSSSEGSELTIIRRP